MSCFLTTTRQLSAHKDVRAGFTLIELMIGLVSSSLLVAGLTSAIYISSQALDIDSSKSRKSAIASEVLGDLMANLALARSFSERTATAVTFDVPDRDGDLQPETIRYAWSGTPGDPLTFQYNGGAEITLASDVQTFDLSALTRSMTAPVIASSSVAVKFEEFTEAKLPSNGISLDVPVPAGTSAGDLLIALVSLDGALDGLAAPAGWNQLVLETRINRMHVGVWWKIATVAEGSAYTFNWNSNEQAYGAVMRFTGHDPLSPINQTAFSGGASTIANAPDITTTVSDAMILRLGAFDDDDISIDSPGMINHNTITMDASGSGNGTTSAGATYSQQSSIGASGGADFTLTNSEEYIAVTIAIAPDTSQ